MPELPEVEIARRSLERWMVGRKIVGTRATITRVLRGSSPEELECAVAGRTPAKIARRGKVLLVGFDNHKGLMAHLGMTGKFVLRRQEESPPSHSRAQFLLQDQMVIHYVDMRLFGRLLPVDDDCITHLPQVRKMGPDPLLDGLTPAVLADRLKGILRPIKVALMDARVVAGIGNIQASEALWRAGIAPDTPSRELRLLDLQRLVDGIMGSIMDTLRLEEQREEIAYVEEAGAPNPFQVYQKAKSPCPRCGTPITKTVLAGRGTYWCPNCQRRRL